VIAGILLAAGQGSRFGGAKLLAPLPGAPGGACVGGRSCAALVAAVTPTLAVLRPGDLRLAAVFAAAGAGVVEFPGADAGMGASLAFGVATLRAADGWVVALADMPWVSPATIRAVAAALAGGAQIVAPVHRGRRGHPVGFGRAQLAALLALGGDRGARPIVDAAGAAVTRIDVDDPGVLRDVDVVADLE
jgi:molybdenum cofactor cytidylyltransferase